MRLTIRQAATFMETSPRTLRAQVARGEIRGVKRQGKWTVERRDLPLTEAQRRRLHRKAATLRQAVDDALSPRLGQSSAQPLRALGDLDAFRGGVRLVAAIRADESADLSAEGRQEVLGLLEDALQAVAEGAYQYDAELKLAALNRARGGMARAAARLLLASEGEPDEAVAGWIAALEGEVLPAVAGYARWSDRLRRRRS